MATVHGTPTTTGTYNFTIRATDANSYTGDQAYTVNITLGIVQRKSLNPLGTRTGQRSPIGGNKGM
jgi:hypothetical protein